MYKIWNKLIYINKKNILFNHRKRTTIKIYFNFLLIEANIKKNHFGLYTILDRKMAANIFIYIYTDIFDFFYTYTTFET